MRCSIEIALAVLIIATSSTTAQQSHRVNSADAVESLLESGRLSPGDTVVWDAGAFQDVELDIVGVNGTKAQPITLKADKPGATVICGESQFKIGTEHWVVDGFHFKGRRGETNAYNTLQFRSNDGEPASHVKLTNCAFTNLTTVDETSKWILIYGQSNTIDRCHFEGKASKGAMITVEMGYLDDDEIVGHQITNNFFGSFSLQEGNDNETIRLGSSKDQHKQGRCLVRGNYFFSCNGENEIVSSKSSYNRFQNNTFRKCDGALVLRHGHHSRVEGNWFFGNDAQNAGGVRVVDSHHLIVNNYFQDLTGDK